MLKRERAGPRAALDLNRLSYDNYARSGAPDPRRINHPPGRSRNDTLSQVFIYFVLINARN